MSDTHEERYIRNRIEDFRRKVSDWRLDRLTRGNNKYPHAVISGLTNLGNYFKERYPDYNLGDNFALMLWLDEFANVSLTSDYFGDTNFKIKKDLIAFTGQFGLDDKCWEIYNSLSELKQRNVIDHMPTHLQSAVRIMA